jgi:hypothetical protein
MTDESRRLKVPVFSFYLISKPLWQSPVPSQVGAVSIFPIIYFIISRFQIFLLSLPFLNRLFKRNDDRQINRYKECKQKREILTWTYTWVRWCND